MPVLFQRPSVNIILDRNEKLYEVNITNEEKYNEPGFVEFITYFKMCWELVVKEGDIYFMVINIHAKGEEDLPLSAFIRLIKVISELNEIFKKHLHSCCIISNGAKKWQDAYELITKIYKPPDQRPLKFTEDKEDAKLFLISNQIIA